MPDPTPLRYAQGAYLKGLKYADGRPSGLVGYLFLGYQIVSGKPDHAFIN